MSLVAASCGSRLPPENGVSAGTAGGTASDFESTSGDGGIAESVGGDSVAAATGPAGGGAAGSGGGRSPGAAASNPTSQPTGQGVTDDSILIGVDAPLSGFAAFLGEEVVGAMDAYAQLVNSRGGINGRKIKLKIYDDRIDFPQMLVNVRKMWEQDKVFAVVVTVADPVLEYVTRNNIPTFVLGISAPPFESKYPTTFPTIGNALLGTHAMMNGLLQKGVVKPGMKVAVAYDTLLDASPYIPYIKEGWEKGGAKVVSIDPFAISDGDCTSLVLKMKQLDIDYWDLVTIGWVLCLSAAQRQGWKPKAGWGGWMTSIAALTKQAGRYGEGIWTMNLGDLPDGSPRHPGPTPATREYAEALKRFHPKMATSDHMNSPATMGYWVVGKTLVAALEAQGRGVNQKAVIDWLHKTKGFDPGITPPIHSFAPDCKTGTAQAWIAQWHWQDDNTLVYQNQSPFHRSPYEDYYGGACYVTKLSDKVSASSG